jgi:hypothetical protein
VEAVAKKLQELNPGFDGKVTGANGGTPWIENGVVMGFGFRTDNVTDISPVRVLEGLRSLTAGGGWHTGLSDLSPLKGMKLDVLNCGQSPVRDLSPLKGMPLRDLRCENMPVGDLSPLKGMPLNQLHCSHTPVSDLSPLKGMRLSGYQHHCIPWSDRHHSEDVSLHGKGSWFYSRRKAVPNAVGPVNGFSCMRRAGRLRSESPSSQTERYLSPAGSPVLDTVISALGTISQVSAPALECPEVAFCASLLPTMTFHTQTGHHAHRLS